MKNRLLPLGLILLLAVLLTPILRNFVREVIVIPLLFVFWLGRFLFEAIPQAGLWGVFFVIFLLIMSFGLLGARKPKPTARQLIDVYQGRIEGWVDLIRRAEQDDYYKWRLAQRLQKLSLSAIAYNQGQSLRQTRQQLRQGELDLPPDLRAYFLASLQSLGYLPAPKRFFRSKTTASSLDLDPIRVVQFLEDLNGEKTQQNQQETLQR